MTGSGTPADPYVISDVDDLQDIELDLTAYYELANDIDASATVGWNLGAGFDPIGAAFPYFTGHFDGKGFVIDALFINRPAEGYNALFHYNHGTIQNVGLTNCDITGGTAASLTYGNAGTISKCYSTGAVVGGNYAGGFVSFQDGGTIQDCYSRCSVSGADFAGGFIHANDSGVIDNCYSTGAVTADNVARGFCRDNRDIITNCFWDTETSGQDTSDGGTGKTTAEMKTDSTFTDAGWDFTTPIWYINSTINDGYPAFIGVVARVKGNINIDQRIYQHVERM